MTEDEELPTSVVRPLRRRSWAWLLPAAALALVAWLLWNAWGERGPRITVWVAQGHKLQAGDALLYRGVAVGEVEDVELERDLARLVVTVRLAPSAAELARAGSRFWIVRPHLALDNVQGLETVVGARYLAVSPGPPGAPRQTHFVALEEPPIQEEIEPEGLQFVLDAPSRFGLSPGAELTYRGFTIGVVRAVELSSDAGSVEVHVYVRPPYTELVREGSRFWETGGLEARFGFTGGAIEMESLRALLVGGIAMATPEEPGPRASEGHRFPLHSEPDDAWLAWSPAIAVGRALERELPAGLPAELAWREKGFFGGRERARAGRVLPVAGGLLGPADLLAQPEGAEEGSARLEVLRRPVELGGGKEVAPGLAILPAELELDPWPAGRMRRIDAPEDLLLLPDAGRDPIAVSAARLSRSGEHRLAIDRSLPVEEGWHGAPVVARSDAALVGLLLDTSRGPAVALLPPPSEQADAARPGGSR